MDHIFTLYAMVQKYLLRNTKLYVAFVDFRKAFDSVNRNALWNVLRNSGLHSKLYKALKGVYNSVLACVRVNSEYSNYFDCPIGVKQGCLLSPQLFSFFINELAVEISSRGKHGIQLLPGAIELFLLLFADDIILLSESVIGLQNQLNMLKIEADRLKLTVNLGKTNIVVFRNGGHLSAHEKWCYGRLEVKVINSYKYLGMIFSTKLSLNYAWDEYYRKGKKGVIQLLKSLRKLNCFDHNIFWKMFDTQIEPLITYGSEIWGLNVNNQIEKVHTYAIKRFLRVPIHSSNTVLYGETGRYPLYIRTFVRCIKYWVKLLKLPSSRICRQAYDMMLLQMEQGKDNWAFKVKTVLSEHGFGIVWLMQELGNERKFISEFKDRIICIYKQNWHSDMESKDKYRCFFSFKNVFQAERYFSIITDKWHRILFTRFRLRTLGFNANKRWFDCGTSTENPCPLCGHTVDDESHFLFDCVAFSDVRKKHSFFKSEVAKRQDVALIVSSTNDQLIQSLAKYIAEAMKMRNK